MSLRFLSRVVTDLSIAALAIGIAACSASSNDGTTFGPGSGAGNSGGSGGGSNDASAGNGGSGGMFLEASIGDGTINSDSACAAEHAKAEQLPLDLYFMVDRSGSMDSYYTSPTKWEVQSSALNAFFSDSQSAGLYVALSFFPANDSCNPFDAQCSGNGYAKPQVDWGVLPNIQPTLSQKIGQSSPSGCFTPTQEALNGLLMGARARQLAEPDHIVAAVFASDGEPCCGSCPCEANACIGQIAAGYATGSPPIKTFAIAADSSAMGVLTAIAQQGGTNTPFDATGGTQSFIDALNAIRGSMLACEYKMPVPEAGTINPNLVQVQFTPTNATDPVTIPHKTDQSQCGSDPGWYYDNNTNPSKIVFCPSTCSMVQNDQSGKLDILLGCSGIQT